MGHEGAPQEGCGVASACPEHWKDHGGRTHVRMLRLQAKLIWFK